MKKIVIVLALIALSLGSFSCGGGGAGGPNVPPGENPGVPSVVQLLPSTFIAQTNSSITLHAKVLDGNGVPVAGIPVIYTNLSHPFGILSSTVANTNSLGIATVTLYSTTSGFATILAQVNTGVGQVRDRKSVFFSTLDVLAVSMSLDVDSVPPSSTPNEPSDFILFEPPPTPDDTVEVLATVFDAGGVPVGGGWGVSWSSSHAEAGFVRTETATNVNGQAKAVVQVKPTSIRDTETHVNIMASAGNGAANMVTLFLRPVIVSSVTVTADKTVLAPSGTAKITAVVMLNTGSPAPSGTNVSFTATCGTVTPFAQTDTSGTAKADYTAPATPGTCTVTATVGGVSGSVTITVTTTLNVVPSSATITTGAACAVLGNNTATYTIIGGVAPYTVSTSHPSITSFTAPAAGDTITVSAAPWQFTIAYDAVTAADTTVTITVMDAVGTTKTADFKIDCP